jgi:dTMP kinase
MAGIFITFEGIEGCGKTTQLELLARHLKKSGREVITTREPGGTPIGERIRSILLDAKHQEMEPITELLLYAAARHQHISEVIQRALESGAVVICDRYADATTAYQGAARNVEPAVLKELHQIATGGLMPHLTILLDCPAQAGLGRARARNAKEDVEGKADRFEREELAFHERVREGYLAIARAEPGRVAVIDASSDAQTTHRRIVEIVEKRLNL